ncbi:MAG: aldo/keto reductase, partial [Pseudolysinimonas sp.]
VEAAKEFSTLAESAGLPRAEAALAWVAQLPGVSAVIPGARNVKQAEANAAAGVVPPLGDAFTAAVHELYDRRFRQTIHARW